MRSPEHYLLNTNIRDQSIRSMVLTNQTGVEHGFYITKNRGKLWMTPIQSGNTNGINLTHNFGESIATVHTHPNEKFESLFSMPDIKSMLDGEMNWSVALYDENGRVMADLFDAYTYSSYQDALGNEQTDLELAKRLNREMLIGKYVLGEL